MRSTVRKISEWFVAGILILILGSSAVLAQSSTQINIVGIPPVLTSPFADDIETNFTTGQYQVIFNYSSFNNLPVDFVFNFVLLKNNRPIVDITSAPRAFTPGSYVFTSFFEENEFRQTPNEIIASLDRVLRNQVIQSGAIPEGNYSIEITARPFSQQTGITPIPGRSMFSVRYPPPPILVSVPNGANLTFDTPTFSWTPVVSSMGGMYEYEFLMVEMFEGQTPLQAINSNREHVLAVLTGQTTLPYTLEYLPLEEGMRYAWQVKAKDAVGNTPLQNDGESEIYTFTFRDRSAIDRGREQIADLEQIILIPGFAELSEFGQLDVEETATSYILNGEAALNLEFDMIGEVQLFVNLQGMEIQRTNLQNPVLMGGSLTGPADMLTSLLPDDNPWINFENLYWSFGQNITVDASLVTPDQQWFDADGELILSRSGLTGEVEIFGDPLVQYSRDFVEFELYSLGAAFPENHVWATGDARVMGAETPCDFNNISIQDSQMNVDVHCDDSFQIPLVEESDLIALDIDRVLGNFTIDLEAASLEYDISLRSIIGMKTLNENYCGSRLQLNFSSEEGVEAGSATTYCSEIEPKIDLGFANLAFENTELAELGYDPEDEQWDFELNFDAKLEIPAFDSWSSITMTGITVNRQGIEFDEFDFEDEFSSLPSFNAQLLEIGLDHFSMNQFTFPLFEWDEQAPGPWDIEFEGSAQIQADYGAPACLLGTTFELSNGRIDQQQVISDLSIADFEGCEWDFGAGYSLQIEALSGVAGVSYPPADEIRPFGNVNLAGDITIGSPFDCIEEQMFSFGGDDISISEGINGTIENAIPGCPVQIGPFSGEVTQSDIYFSVSEIGTQKAVMDAAATITFQDSLEIDGSVEIDLMTGEFIDVSFIIDEPFEWHIPSGENPVLSFMIDQAEITSQGFFVDGRQTFLLPNSEMGVTFDNLLVDLNNFRVKSGRIIFDDSYSFEIGIADNLTDLAFNSVEPESELILDPGVLMDLGGTVTIDSLGVHTSGSATASMAFNSQRFDTLVTVEYTDDFRLSLNPVEVKSGQADFYFNGDRFAYIDPSGFNPVMAFFADFLIPERLPLPTESIAYLQLRDGDDLLVDVTENGEGEYIISTLPDTPISLVVPYLDPASPPVLADVSLNDLTISANPFSPEVISGSITADVPSDDPFFNLTDRNIPLTLETIEFGSRTVNGSSITALYLLGNLHLFEQELEDESQVEFYLRGDGFVRAALDMSGLNTQFSIAPQDRAIVGVNALNGSFQMPVGPGSPVYDFSASGSLEVLTDQGYRAGADLTVRTESGGFFSITEFDGYAFDESPRIGIGNFGLDLEEIISVPEFSYSIDDGFEFAVQLDLKLGIELSDGEEINFPLQGVEIRHDGIHFPTQDINESSIPGLNLPEINLAGFGFQPLALRTPSGFSYSWEDGPSFDFEFLMDFSVDLPEFEGTGINPPDGLLFTDIGFDDGFLTGSLEPFNPLGDVEIPIAPGDGSPTLFVEEISGALAKVPSNSFRQVVDIDISGTVGNLPAFTVDDPEECAEGATYSLSIIEGRAIEGSITDFQPCGYLELGPVSIEVPSANLNFYLDEDEQIAELDGAVNVTLPAPGEGTPAVVSGELVLDIITAQIRGGAIAITQPFGLNMPLIEDDDPLFIFNISEASLDSDGLTLSGQGNLEKGEINANVAFDDLLIGLSSMTILDGLATIDSDFAVQFTPSPFAFELVSSTSPLPADNVLRMDLNAAVALNQYGLGFSGSADATLLYSSEEYTNLRVELVDDFAMSLSGLSVTRGAAEFYWDQDGVPAADPMVIINEGGFNLGAGLITLLPDRLPLPTEDIAYIELKDESGVPYIEAESTDTGYTLTTGDDYLPIVIAALDGGGEPLTTGVNFTLQTDDAFNVTGGSLSLQTNFSLEDRLNLPVTLTDLNLSTNDGIKLEVGLSFELPAVLEGHDATVFATLSSSGIESGSFSVGEVGSSYDSDLDPIYTFSYSGNVNDSEETDAFEASLMGIEATFGSNSVSFSGTLSSSIVMDEGDTPLFFTASWSESEWAFNLDPGNALNNIRLGQSTISLDESDPLALVSDEDNFYLNINGQISFEEILEEPVMISVQDLQIGVNDYRTSPSLHFALGQAMGELGNQEIELFDSALIIELIDPTVTLTGRELAISSNGNIQFLEQQIDYTGFQVSTSGEFQLDEVSASDIEIFEEYIVLQSFALSFDDGLRIDSRLSLNLPAPVQDFSVVDSLTIYRDNDGEIKVENSGVQIDMAERFELLNFGEFELSKVRAQINPFDWSQSGLYANGSIYLGDDPDPIIEFGKAGNFPEQPGIGIFYNDSQELDISYDVTGNAEFEFDISFFRVAVSANMNTSSGAGFELLLGGEADLNLEAVEASLAYDGIVITEEGLDNYGNITSGSIDIAGVATLKVGQFIYKSEEGGFSINIANTEEKSPEELQGNGDFDSDELASNSIEVVELLCFGPCPEIDEDSEDSDSSALELSIGGDGGNGSGGISGGVDRVMFYRTADGVRSLTIENLNAQFDDIFTMNASINYVQDGSEILLRAAATGSFEVGGTSASAVVAGKFSNIGGEVSFGLFVAVQADVGIPIVPGVIDLTGAGGGFFYKPVQEDLDMVHASMENFGHELVNSDGAGIQGGADFAIMLYAAIGIAGGGDNYVMEGSTFFQITNQSFYMDARAHVLGMDGVDTIAGTQVTGEMSASVSRTPFAILVTVDVAIDVPVILEGSGGIEFFMAGEGEDRVWGIIGNAQFGIYGNILQGSGEFLAGDPGFMFEVTLTFDLNIKIIDIQSSVTGSVWVMTDPDYSFPFGAYVVFDVEATVLKVVTVSAEAKAAFVTRNPSGYEFFATAYGCAKVVKEKCGSAWASYSSQDGLDYGRGAGDHADLVAQAQQQQDDFRDHINSLMDELDAALDVLFEGPSYSELIGSAEDAQEAGYNLYRMSQSKRHAWVNEIYNMSQAAQLPSALTDVVNNVMRSTGPQFPSPMNEITELQKHRGAAVSILQSLQDLIAEDMLTAYDMQDAAEQSYQQLIATMSTSPVQNVVKPTPSTDAAQSVSFDINDNLAGQQVQSSEQYRAEMEQLDEQIRADIEAVRGNLDVISNLLQTDTPTTEDNHLINLAHWFGEIYMQMERYYAFEANKAWNEYFWADNHLSYLNANSSAINSAISGISNAHRTLMVVTNNYRSIPQPTPNDMINSVNSYAWDVSQRENFIYRLNRVYPYTQPSLSNPDVAPTPAYIRNMYNDLTYPVSSSILNDMSIVNTINHNFWWEMNVGGLQTLRNTKQQSLVNVLLSDNEDYIEQLLSPQKNITLILDEFYNIKANVTAILYNMIDEYLEWRADLAELQEEDVAETPATRRDESDETDTGDQGGIGGMLPMTQPSSFGQTANLDLTGMMYSSLRNTLAQQLQPPQILDITANPNRPENNYVDTYYNQTEIEWNATHPSGIIETSINVLYPGIFSSVGTDIAVGIENYLSVGNRSSFTLYPYRILLESRDINFGVRVRGTAGNTAMRRASFTVDVGPSGSSSVEPGESVVPETTSPPPPPTIDLTESFSVTNFGGEETFWTSMPQDFQLIITAHDPEVGIGKWEYAIGTSPGGTDVEDWRLLQGQIQFLPEIPGHRITAPARSLEMQPGVEYYISARVENTLGQLSPPTELSSPFIYDDEGPSNVIFEQIHPEPHVPTAELSTMVYDPVSVVPSFTSDMSAHDFWTNTYGEATLYFEEIGASDDMSGVSHFEYIFSGNEEPPMNRFDIDDFQTLEGSDLTYTNLGSPAELSYNNNPYWHIRAVDYAGNRGEVYTYGPFEAFDFTIPNAGKLQAKVYHDDVKVYIVDPPFDPESDVLGIQYAVGTSRWYDDLRAFPGGSTVDLEWNLSKSEQLLYGSGNPQRYISIPRTDLPEPGEEFYILYRSVNTKGMYSYDTATGPIILDHLPPNVPDVNVQVDMQERKINLDIMNISAPETGVTKVEYWVQRPYSSSFGISTFSFGWSTLFQTTIQSYASPQFGTLQLSTTSPFIDHEYDPTNLRVRVRITNAAGKKRTRTVEITENDLYNFPVRERKEEEKEASERERREE